ncbi:MAG: hypothetical protein J6A16_09595 [Oscillospiraceae bacterium]|nr:hypothetical protein [Oscillospiraceae bacterium]
MFVLYCQCGREAYVVEQLRQEGITAYSPKKLVTERRRGMWCSREDTLFDGYVFIDRTELTADLYYTAKSCIGAIRFVSRSQLSDTEEEYIRTLCNSGECIGISRGYIKDGALHITEGFLRALEHKIVKYNRRGRRATADVTMYGMHYRVTLTVEFDPPPAVSLISSDAAKNTPVSADS